jgi:DNA-directed RNA polymerase specialized sigma24 family protein
MLAQNSPSGKIAKDLTGWRLMAWEALQRKKLGDTLRSAIGALSAKYREVLFLQDVKNLDTEETAWVLHMPAETVRSRLLKARTQVRNALASALFPKPGEKNSRRGNSCAREFACDFQAPTHRNSFSLA